MQTLIRKIAVGANINENQAQQALFLVCNHLQEQFPFLITYTDSILGVKEDSFINQTYVIAKPVNPATPVENKVKE